MTAAASPAADTETRWFYERLHPSVRVNYAVDKVVYEHKSAHQDILIFDNKTFGRMLTLDHIVQVTEADEPCYHEMMVHVPLLSHPAPKRVLIIGGGDGGIARECLRHPVEHVHMVELDDQVVTLCQEYMPKISNGAFSDPRLELTYTDGFKYVAETTARYDVIIVDSTDPIGPGAVLFSPEFYQNCAKCLTDQGILVTQNGVPSLQGSEIRDSYQSFTRFFKDAWAYTVAVPTYFGGLMTLGWASHSLDTRAVPLTVLEERFAARGLDCFYYTPALHKAAFALPNFIQKTLKNS